MIFRYNWTMGYKVNSIYLSGAFLLVFIFGMLGSQQALAGDGSSGNIIVTKAVTEGSVGSCTNGCDPFFVEEGNTVVFNIVVRWTEIQPEGSVGSIVMNDLLPSGLTYDSHSNPTGEGFSSDYNPNTGDWTISGLGAGFEGSTSSLQITTTVAAGTCGGRIRMAIIG